MPRARPALVLPALGTLLALAGCAATVPPPPPAVVAPDDYPRTFSAAKDTLRGLGFALERVDAASGVIATRYKPTAGLATPWDQEQSSFEDELREAFNSEGRVVRVAFAPADSTVALDPTADLRAVRDPLAWTVRVQRFRVVRPNRQVETSAINLTSHAVNPDAVDAGLEPAYAAEVGPDHPLAARIRAEILRRLAQPPQPAAGSPE